MGKPKLDNNTVYLIDGSGYIFRAYYAIRSLSSKSGLPTNAVYGFTTMLIKLLREHKPKFVAMAFDRKEKTFRHNLYADYKGNRPEPPKDLVPQFDLIRRLVDAFRIQRLDMAGFEADDLIATMARKAKAAGHEVVVVTGDKDFMQLVDDDLFLLDELRASRNGAELFIDAPEVFKQMGVWPNQVVDLLALAGDSSDNIPGVAGIGVKTAAELIQEFGSVEKILEMVPLIKQKARRERLIDGHHSALLSKKLVTIDAHAPVDLEIADLRYEGFDHEKVRSFFLELDFNRLLNDKELFVEGAAQEKGEQEAASSEATVFEEFAHVSTENDLEKLLLALSASPKIAVNVETESLDSMTAELKGLGLAWDEHHAAQISWELLQQLPRSLAQLKSILLDPTKYIVAHDAKFHHKILARSGLGEFAIGGDPMLASYLLTQDQDRHDLSSLAAKYLGLEPVAMSSARKAHLSRRLLDILEPKLVAAELSSLYTTLELPLEEVLSRMEIRGVKVDRAQLKILHDELSDRLTVLERSAHELAGMPFNLASPKQVSEILFNRLSLPMIKKTKTGSSTDSMVLEKLAPAHPLAGILLEHRLCAKLISTYAASLPTLINANTGRIHTSYNQFVTATGRLSSSDPNLQNIPIRTAEGRRCRKAFVAKDGFVLISLDYSQVELRLLALASQDEVLLDSFAKDQDVHQRTAAEIFDQKADEVSKDQRNVAKTINFGLLYGMGAHRLAQSLNISRAQAQNYLEKYFTKYAGIVRWKNEVLEKAKQQGEVRTLFGRLRKVPELASDNAVVRARGERLAINTPIQGTAADIIKKAMIDCERLLSQEYPESHLIMQVHDELVIEAKVEDAENIARAVARIMSHGHGLDLDLKVEFGIAPNWGDAH